MSNGSGITPVNPSGNTSAPNKGQVVQIVTLPEMLESNARPVRLEGEVLQQNKDGSVRVRTPEGDIDINVRGRQPQQGQKIEIDIPAGSPPRNATIRNAPPQPQTPQPQQPAPPTTTTPQPNVPLPQTPPAQGQTPAPPPTTGGTTQPLPQTPAAGAPKPPVDTYQPAPPQTGATKPLPASPLPPLSAGQIVKLVPMPALPMENAIPTIAPKVAAQTANIAQKAEGNLINTLLQAVKSAIPQSILPGANNPTPTLAKPLMPVPSTSILPNTAMPQTLTLSAQIISLTLPSGQTLTMPQTAAMPAPVMTSPATQAAVITAPLLNVTVTELTAQSQPIIPVPINDKGAVQNFVLQSPPATVPVGTQITLQPQLMVQGLQAQAAQIQTPALPTGIIMAPVTAAPVAPMPVGTTPVSMLPPAWRALLPLMQPASLWPAMDDIFQAFYQTTPQAAQILGRTIPSPSNGGNFGPAILLFAAAIKSGDLQTWLGDKKLDMIQKLGKGSLLSRLSGETSSLAGNTDAASTEWKSFPVPMLWQNEISKVMFHVRKEPSENENENGDGATRFVMDLSLTRMGDVQLDGMVRGKQLDLIVRTQLPISASMQEAMRLAYAKALDGTDIFGDMGFQSDRTNWENIIKQQEVLAASV